MPSFSDPSAALAGIVNCLTPVLPTGARVVLGTGDAGRSLPCCDRPLLRVEDQGITETRQSATCRDFEMSVLVSWHTCWPADPKLEDVERMSLAQSATIWQFVRKLACCGFDVRSSTHLGPEGMCLISTIEVDVQLQNCDCS